MFAVMGIYKDGKIKESDEDFFNYNLDDDVKENMEIGEGILCKGGVECRQVET